MPHLREACSSKSMCAVPVSRSMAVTSARSPADSPGRWRGGSDATPAYQPLLEHPRRLVHHGSALARQLQIHAARVGLAAGAGDEPRGGQPRHHHRHRAGVRERAPGEVGHGERLAMAELLQDEELRSRDSRALLRFPGRFPQRAHEPPERVQRLRASADGFPPATATPIPQLRPQGHSPRSQCTVNARARRRARGLLRIRRLSFVSLRRALFAGAAEPPVLSSSSSALSARWLFDSTSSSTVR